MSEFGSVTIGPYRAGEIPAPIVVTFRDANGVVLDLTGYVARWVYQRHSASGFPDFTATDPAAVTQTATLLNQTTNKGQVQYTFVALDFQTAGYYEGEMWVGNGTNRYASVRFMWTTTPAISVPAI